MRIILLLLALALGADAYFFSGTYTKAAVNGISTQVQDLTSNASTNSKNEIREQRSAQRNAN